MPNKQLESPANIAYLNMLQSAIKRMATNSLYMKILCGALMPILFSITLETCSFIFFSLILIGIICFIDLKYLSLEKCYRDKYKDFLEFLKNDLNEQEEKTYPTLYEMIPEKEKQKSNFKEAISSWSVYIYYVFFMSILFLKLLK